GEPGDGPPYFPPSRPRPYPPRRPGPNPPSRPPVTWRPPEDSYHGFFGGPYDPQSEARRARRMTQLQMMVPTPNRRPQIPTMTVYAQRLEPESIHWNHARNPNAPAYGHRLYGAPMGQF
ncbi:MAG TPA: hypothetical protein V6D08_19440, partial [Candidatus Obscuribacterales bacterium]